MKLFCLFYKGGRTAFLMHKRVVPYQCCRERFRCVDNVFWRNCSIEKVILCRIFVFVACDKYTNKLGLYVFV